MVMLVDNEDLTMMQLLEGLTVVTFLANGEPVVENVYQENAYMVFGPVMVQFSGRKLTRCLNRANRKHYKIHMTCIAFTSFYWIHCYWSFQVVLLNEYNLSRMYIFGK